jgi:tRNA G10  N-methylase Trm11
MHAAVEKISDPAYRDFARATLSAVNRNVSNADPQHVFPGYSKRLRKLDLERGRKLDVFDTFISGAKKRAEYLRELGDVLPDQRTARVIHGHADATGLPDESVDLIVTNPPYISSVRYLETLKLEMSWAGYIESADAYRDMDRLQFGTERYTTSESDSFHISGVRQVDMLSRKLFDKGQTKMSLTVSSYFRRILAALDEWNRVLRPGGKIVLKISPSKVRSEIINTPKIVGEQLERKGYKIVEQFEDDYNQNSRSLLTARNYYSGRMDSDLIQVLVKL